VQGGKGQGRSGNVRQPRLSCVPKRKKGNDLIVTGFEKIIALALQPCWVVFFQSDMCGVGVSKKTYISDD
jgi:hypothetical protein